MRKYSALSVTCNATSAVFLKAMEPITCWGCYSVVFPMVLKIFICWQNASLKGLWHWRGNWHFCHIVWQLLMTCNPLLPCSVVLALLESSDRNSLLKLLMKCVEIILVVTWAVGLLLRGCQRHCSSFILCGQLWDPPAFSSKGGLGSLPSCRRREVVNVDH